MHMYLAIYDRLLFLNELLRMHLWALSGLLLIGIFVCLWTSRLDCFVAFVIQGRGSSRRWNNNLPTGSWLNPYFLPEGLLLVNFGWAHDCIPLTNDDGFFVAENSSTKTTQAKEKKRKNSRCERQWIVYIDPVSSSYRKRVFFWGEWERVLYLLVSTHTIRCGGGGLVPLSSAQGWLDAYFVNIRTCEVKRNIQKGTNKPRKRKKNKKINNLWTWSCNQRRVGDFSFPSHRLFSSSCCCYYYICLRLSFVILFPPSDWIFSPDRDDQNEDAKTKAPKRDSRTEMTKQCRPKTKFTTRNFLSALASRGNWILDC